MTDPVAVLQAVIAALTTLQSDKERMREALEAISKLQMSPRLDRPSYLIDYWHSAFVTVRNMAREALTTTDEATGR